MLAFIISTAESANGNGATVGDGIQTLAFCALMAFVFWMLLR